MKLACRRHLAGLARQDWPYRFDGEKASRACSFIKLLPYAKGEWARRRELIKLQARQAFFIRSLFGWVDRKTGLRRLRLAVLLMPRKNSKSALADGEHGAVVYSGATTEKQAWEMLLAPDPRGLTEAESPVPLSAVAVTSPAWRGGRRG